MNDPQLWCGQIQQSSAKLLGKLACEVEGDTVEVGIPQQFIQVVREKLKHETKVAAEHEVAFEAHCTSMKVRGRESK